jgi:hypothetical protein
MREIIENQINDFGLPVIVDQKSGATQWLDLRELSVRYVISIENVKPFFEGLREGKLLTTKCKRCGRLFFPPQRDCPGCRVSDMEWVELSKEATLETLTVIFVKPPSVSEYEPYTVAIAKLAEGPRITAWLRGDPRKAKPGMRVKLEVSKRKEGYYMYELVPVE